MTDRQETIADIIAEMKREAAKIFPALPIAVLQLATRLEAAWKRELLTKPAENVNSGEASDTAGNCAKLREALVETLGYIESFHKYIIPGKRKKLTALFAVADTIRGKVRAALAAPATTEKSLVVGDCAKLREALKAIGDLCDGLMPTWDGAIGRIKDMAETALGAPPRNCDVGTPEEQDERFAEYCESEVCKRKRCKFSVQALCIERCALVWAQMPYKEGGAR